MTTEYRIEGMMCAHCQARVEKELSTLPGVTSVAVDLGRKVARVEGTATEQEIAAKVTALGYEFGGSV
jgi:copper chaperone CopZ